MVSSASARRAIAVRSAAVDSRCIRLYHAASDNDTRASSSYSRNRPRASRYALRNRCSASDGRSLSRNTVPNPTSNASSVGSWSCSCGSLPVSSTARARCSHSSRYPLRVTTKSAIAAINRDPFHATEAFIAETEASLDSLAETSNRRGFLLVNRRLGDAYMRRLVGDRTDNARSAITAYQRAMELAEPQSVELAGVHRNLGDAYRVVADSEAASHSYRAALAAYADADRHEARDVADVFAQLYVIEARRIRRSLPQLAGPRSAGGAP